MSAWQHEHLLDCAHGRLAYRDSADAGAGGPALVLLHGIGSGAPSWQGLADQLAGEVRVLAWDAPGYGGSGPLPMGRPQPQDYAELLDTWLQALGLREPVLVGHSLGAIVAAAWATRSAAKPQALVLASPARGYGRSPADLREARRRERIEAIERLGPHGMAAERAANLCRPGADAAVVEQVRATMQRVTVPGYVQAAHLLADGDLLSLLPAVRCPVTVLCGELDRVTPPDACAEVAAAAGVPLALLPGVGHASYVEDPAAFAAALRGVLAGIREDAHVR